MKKLMIVGCAAVAALNAVAGTTNTVTTSNVAKSKEVVQAIAEREEQRKRLIAIQDGLKKSREESASSACAKGNTTVDELLDIYSDQVGKTLLRDPSVQNTPIKFKVCERQKLTKEEYIGALEAVLEMNGVHLEPDGEKLVHVFQGRDAIKKGVPLIATPRQLEERGRIVSMMIPFTNIGVAEAQRSLEGLKSNSGVFFVYERTNSILVTDIDKNINRMLSIAKAIDVATPVTTATTETILAQKQQPAAEKMFKSAVNDNGHIVIERDDKLLVRIKVKALLKVLAGDKVTNNSLRIYYQNPEDSGDMQCKR